MLAAKPVALLGVADLAGVGSLAVQPLLLAQAVEEADDDSPDLGEVPLERGLRGLVGEALLRGGAWSVSAPAGKGSRQG